MDIALIILLGAVGVYLALNGGVNVVDMTIEEQVKAAILSGIIMPLQLNDLAAGALYAQSHVETGGWKAASFIATNSLFNRHKGSGRGEWTGKTFYASSLDPDLRIFVDVYQSARDMAQLLTDPLYKNALIYLRYGDVRGYFGELHRVGFSTDPVYATTLQRRYAEVV